MDVVNTYFNKSSIPLGAYKGPFARDQVSQQDKYVSFLLSKFEHAKNTSSQVPDATQVYQTILQSQPDSSVTIVSLGFPMNLYNTLLSNNTLVNTKVKQIYWQNGIFNFGCGTTDRILGN